LTPARILVLYVSVGVLLGALGWYEPIKELAGCGATVPLIGFGANIASGVKKAVMEDGFLGIFKGGFTAAAVGCSAALVFGYLAALLFKGKKK
ncbi:MAG: SpoVA/SpoVAEb family sporulation membrane protein, partial [Clostridia bacterium]|nr:SpoVA/SpoVAEb family sporulation membrane protein [Clostridia bacterium]